MAVSPVSWPWWGFVPLQKSPVSLLIPSLCFLHSLCHPKCHQTRWPWGHRALFCLWAVCALELGRQHQHCPHRHPVLGTEPRLTGRSGMSIAGSSPGLGMVSWVPTPAHQGLVLGWELWRSPWSLPLEMALVPCVCSLSRRWSWGAAQGVCALPAPSAIDPPRLGSLLEPLLALPQELTWLFFSPHLSPSEWHRAMAGSCQHCGHGAGSTIPAQEAQLGALGCVVGSECQGSSGITIWCPI